MKGTNFNINAKADDRVTFDAYSDFPIDVPVEQRVHYNGRMLADGRAHIAVDDACSNGGMNLTVNAAGGRVWQGRYELKDGQNESDVNIELTAGGVDPFSVPLEDLRNFRGSIWTARAATAKGPRPGDASNICAFDYFAQFSASDQVLMFAEYVAKRRYKHAPTGPFVDPGYHGLYDPVDFRGDNGVSQAAALQQMWNGGTYPVAFLTPDQSPTTGGPWTLEECETLTPIFQRPEWQRVVRLAVPFGWEPGTYDISNAEWVARFEWARRCFPNARLGLHNVADFDAPIGGNDGLAPINMTKQQAWTNVYNAGCRFILRQVGGYVDSGNVVPTPQFIADFQADLAWFVRNFAAWGLTDFDVIAGEYAAYVNFWQNAPEVYAVQLGDAAMQVAGVRGFFDGGTA